MSIFSVVQVEMDTARFANVLAPIHQWVRCYTRENVFLVITTVRTLNPTEVFVLMRQCSLESKGHLLKPLNFLITLSNVILLDIDCLQFMDISKCYKLISCETMRFLVERKRN